MGTILDSFKRFFEDDDWPYTEMADRAVLKSGFNGDHGQFTLIVQERAEQEQMVVYSMLPVKTPEALRATVAEFITRANYGMIIGNFELDYNDGEVRYKTSLDVENAQELYPLIKNLVYSNVMTMDRYMPGLMRVIYGGVSAQEAVQEIEG